MIIGVTGSLATGKTTTATYLQAYLRGHRIDADRITHSLLLRKSPAHGRIVSLFGREILDNKGNIDKDRLAGKAFYKKTALRRLCNITHPLILDTIRNKAIHIINRDKDATIIIDAPLLIETGLNKECDFTLVVTSSLALQLERAKRHKNIDSAQALLRIRQQIALFKKVLYADCIIANNGTLTELKARCKKIATYLCNRS